MKIRSPILKGEPLLHDNTLFGIHSTSAAQGSLGQLWSCVLYHQDHYLSNQGVRGGARPPMVGTPIASEHCRTLCTALPTPLTFAMGEYLRLLQRQKFPQNHPPTKISLCTPLATPPPPPGGRHLHFFYQLTSIALVCTAHLHMAVHRFPITSTQSQVSTCLFKGVLWV